MPAIGDFSRNDLGTDGANYARINIGESSGFAGGGSAWRYLNPLYWFGKKVTYATELRYFNTFRREATNVVDRKEERALTTQNRRRERQVGGECWTEEEVTYQVSTRDKILVTQYYEIWSVNVSKQGYYSVATGWQPVVVDAGIVGGGATLAAMGQFAKTASGTAGRMGSAAVASEASLATTSMFLSGAARANAALGVGTLVFQGTSWVMILTADDGAGGTEEFVSSGWQLSEIEWSDWEDAGTERRWEEVAGSRRPCGSEDAPDDAISVPAGGSGTSSTGDHEADVPGGPPTETVPVPETGGGATVPEPLPAGGGLRFPGGIRGALGGIAGLFLIGGALLFGGGDDEPGAGDASAGGAANGAAAASATASSGAGDGVAAISSSTVQSGGSSSIPSAPLIVNPCDVFTAAEVSAMFGKTLIADGGSNDRRAICTFRRPEDAGGIHVEVQRNSSSAGFLDEFRKQRADQLATSIDWPNEAELREGEGSSSFWGYVIADDPLGRDVFIWIAGSTEGNSTAVLDLAERLRDAVLEANGRPSPGS